MKQFLTRRAMLQQASGAALSLAFAPLSLPADTPRKERLGVCSISYALRWPTVDRGQAPVTQTIELIEHCHRLGAGGVQTTIIPHQGASAALRAKVEALDMYLEGQVSLPRAETDLDTFEQRVRAAKEAGVSVLRTACLSGRRYEVFKDAPAFAEFSRQSEQSLRWAEPIVRKYQVRLAVENHKDWLTTDLLQLLKRLDSEFVGICLDTGNSIALLEDPMAVVAAYAPYTFATHLKDMAVAEYESGFLLAEVALGDGFLDLREMVRVLRRAQPQLHFSLEMITRDALRIPCLTDGYWPTFQTRPASALAATLALVRHHAAAGSLPHVTGLSLEEKRVLEERAVQRSLVYARENLGL